MYMRTDLYRFYTETHTRKTTYTCVGALFLEYMYPQSPDVEVLTPIPQTVTVFGNRVFTELIKLE